MSAYMDSVRAVLAERERQCGLSPWFGGRASRFARIIECFWYDLSMSHYQSEPNAMAYIDLIRMRCDDRSRGQAVATISPSMPLFDALRRANSFIGNAATPDEVTAKVIFAYFRSTYGSRILEKRPAGRRKRAAMGTGEAPVTPAAPVNPPEPAAHVTPAVPAETTGDATIDSLIDQLRQAQARVKAEAEAARRAAEEAAKRAADAQAIAPRPMPAPVNGVVTIDGVKFPLVYASPQDAPAEIRDCIPTPDPRWDWDGIRLSAALGTCRADYTAQDIVDYLYRDAGVIWIAGPKGCGKTEIVTQICALMNWPLIRVNLSRRTDPSALFGSRDAQNGSTSFIHGPIPRAWKFGAVLLIDEPNFAPVEVHQLLHEMLERRGHGKVTVAANRGEVIQRHNWGRVVFCDNAKGGGDVTGRYVGLNDALNDAFTSRVNLWADAGYPSADAEMRILRAYGLPKAVAEKMLKIADETRKSHAQFLASGTGIASPISTRELANWAETIPILGMKKATLGALNGRTGDDAIAIAEIAQRILGAEIA